MKKPLKNRIFTFFRYLLLLMLMLLLAEVFWPRRYNVPELRQRAGTKYWDLPTGSRIGYTVIQAKNKKKPYPIIYLHGGPGGPVYNTHIAVLGQLSNDGYDVYLYDQVGCGQSGVLENIRDYTADRHKRDLEEITKKIPAEKFILIGQSWGGVLATLFFADNPEKVEKLILTGPGPVFPVKKRVDETKVPDSLHLRDPLFSNADANQVAQNTRSRAIMYWAKIFGRRLASEKEANDFAITMTNQTNKSMVCDTAKALKAEPGVGFYAQIMTVESFEDIQDPRPKMTNARVPLLMLKGQCDNHPWWIEAEYLDLFPNHELVIIPNAGHGIAIEEPDLYLKAIRNFLQK